MTDTLARTLRRNMTEAESRLWSKLRDRLWVVEVIAPFGGSEEMVKDLKAKVFPDRQIKYLAAVDGRKVVRVA